MLKHFNHEVSGFLIINAQLSHFGANLLFLESNRFPPFSLYFHRICAFFADRLQSRLSSPARAVEEEEDGGRVCVLSCCRQTSVVFVVVRCWWYNYKALRALPPTRGGGGEGQS